jgi:hypothetical protein
MTQYITTAHGIRGFFAVMRDANDEPIQTGIGSHAKQIDAEREAREWAEAEGVEFRPAVEVLS